MGGVVALIAVLLAALYVCWLLFQPFFNVLLWAAVLCVVFYPMHRRILERTGRPTVAAALSTISVVLLILLPVTAITVAVVHELGGAAAKFQSPDQWTAPPGVARALDLVGRYVDIDRDTARKFVAERMQMWGTALAASTLVLVGGAVGAVVQTLLVVFTLFYFFRDGENIRHAAYRMVPLRRTQWHDIIARTRDVIGATVYGVLVIAAIQGTLGTLIFWVLGLPSPLLWGVVMFFLSMIPMAGAFLVWVPAAVYLALVGAFVKALILVGWGVLVIGTIDNILSPRLVGRRARLHELLIFFAVLGGLQVFGVLGLVLGPVVVAMTLALIEMAREAADPGADPSTGVIEEQGRIREGR